MAKPARYRRPALPLKTHGGKKYLAPWIVSHACPHLHYVEPYFGGGAVLLARDPERDWFIDEAWRLANGDKVPSHLKGCSEVVGDINWQLTNFWDVLRDGELFPFFQRFIEAAPFSQDLFQGAMFATSPVGHRPPLSKEGKVSLAAAFFIRARQSMSGRMIGFTPLTRNRTRGGRNAEASAWWNCIEGLPEVRKRLQGVAMLTDDAVNVIRQQDGDKTLFYCDPPYLHETRTTTKEYGENEMTPEQHEELLKTLADTKGKFQLSGYRSKMYDDFAVMHGWRREEFVVPNNASSKKKKERKVECLWMNY